MFGWCFPHTVKFKSPHNVFARRLRRVVQAAWCPERASWVCFFGNGKRAEIPGDHAIVFGCKVSVTDK